MSEIIDQIIRSINPASISHATGAMQTLMRVKLPGKNESSPPLLPEFGSITARLCAARHSRAPSVKHATMVIVGADHGVSGMSGQTAILLQRLAQGATTIHSTLAQTDTELLLVDAGVRTDDHLQLDSSILSFRIGNGTADIGVSSAMSPKDAKAAIQTGIAIVGSLVDSGIDLLCLGLIATNAEAVSTALISAITGKNPEAASPKDSEAISKALMLHKNNISTPIDILTHLGGFDIGVLTGMILGAAAVHVPILLDGHGTSASALLASQFCPQVQGYLFASHQDGIDAHASALEALQLTPLISQGGPSGSLGARAIPILQAAAHVFSQSVD